MSSNETYPSHVIDDEGDEELEGNPANDFDIRSVEMEPSQHGLRLDQALAQAMPDVSRSFIHALLAEDRLTCVNPAQVGPFKPAYKVRAGQLFKLELRPSLQSLAFTPQQLPIETIYCDEHIRVIQKSAGVVVHPAHGNWTGTLLNGLLFLDPAAQLLPRAGIVHRLDKDTSGLMVIARSRIAMDILVDQIANRLVNRQYLALVHKSWVGGSRDVSAAIGRDPQSRLRMTVVDISRHAGKSAKTHLECLSRSDQASLMRCTLYTGRTHQIRVHLMHLGYPLIGDVLYGGKAQPYMSRQALHAYRLGFDHPMSGEPLNWETPLPADMLEAIARSGLRYN